MIYTKRIRRTLKYLNSEYKKNILHSDPQVPVLTAKIAVIEYCGWIENTFDEIAINCVRESLRTSESRKFLEKKISDTHGFVYKTHARQLLVVGLGLKKLIKIEKKLNKTGDLDLLKNHLGNMNTLRREAAHTYTTGQTTRYDSPETILRNFDSMEPIFQRLWQMVREN